LIHDSLPCFLFELIGIINLPNEKSIYAKYMKDAFSCQEIITPSSQPVIASGEAL